MMKITLSVLILCFSLPMVFGQSRSELEKNRKKTLEEIEYVDNLLQSTAKEKNQTINEVNIIGHKVSLRENVISDLNGEINLLEERIQLNALAVEMMIDDEKLLKDGYKRAVLSEYKIKKTYPELLYILSAKDFNQGYKRYKYLRQFGEEKKRETELITELRALIESTGDFMKEDLQKVSELKSHQVLQRNSLKREQESQQKLVKALTSREKNLKKQLDEKRKIARKIEAEIAKLIEEESAKAGKESIKTEDKLIGDNFGENKGRLPWPVDRGIVTSHFGVQKNPVLKYLTEENIGIEISGKQSMPVKNIFNGEVVKVFAIQGANMTVIIRHGNYLSIYSNIINLKVKKGDKVNTAEQIGEAFTDPAEGTSMLKFMIFESRYQDPELWLIKNMGK